MDRFTFTLAIGFLYIKWRRRHIYEHSIWRVECVVGGLHELNTCVLPASYHVYKTLSW